MANLPADGTLVLVDACCWINLLASQRLEEILGAVPYRWASSSHIADREVLTALDSDESGAQTLFLRDLEARGVISLTDVRSESETDEFVRFAAELDDGEASICALAVTRGAAVATDDRKAIRILTAWAPNIAIIQTASILQRWAESTRTSADKVRDLLRRIERCARFLPSRNAPSADWWMRSRG